ncbi:MAG: hypothetical protein IKV62_01465 [Bacteroidales bacterium]|nr:hypothetical protein [Bacteroidales bacterium]
MKKIIILLGCFLFGCVMYAQDIITKKDGTDIQTKVTEVGESQISYKKFSNLNGPVYTISISDVLMITYENGEREMYNVEKKSSLPQGVMTYNSWSGKVSVGGVTVENEMLDRFFTPEDYQLFKRGRSVTTVGSIFAVAGALPFGYSLGYMGAAGETDETNMALLIGGGAVMVAGFIVGFTGESKMKKAIANYNSALTFQPEVHFGATNYGVGIALVF